MNQLASLTILVSGCDKNIDLLKPFFQSFYMHFKDNPFPIDFVTETYFEELKLLPFSNIYSNPKEKSWCKRLFNAVNLIETKYILLTLEDFFLSENISGDDFERFINIAEKHNVGALRIGKTLKPEIGVEKDYGMFQKGTAYSVCAQVTIWNKRFLLDILQELGDCSAWEFERKGSNIAKNLNQDIYSFYVPPYKYCETVAAGRWIHEAVIYCDKKAIKIDIEKRKKEPMINFYYRQLKGFVLNLNPNLINKLVLITKQK